VEKCVIKETLESMLLQINHCKHIAEKEMFNYAILRTLDILLMSRCDQIGLRCYYDYMCTIRFGEITRW